MNGMVIGGCTMHYEFELCPKCKDNLIERVIDDFQEYIPGNCLNCGSRMESVMSGKKRQAMIYIKLH